VADVRSRLARNAAARPAVAYPCQVTTVLVFSAAGAVVLALVVWAGTRMVRTSTGGAGIADGLGNFNEVFDPARARADQDLKSKEHQGEVVPLPEDEDRPIAIDLISMRARIKRPTVRPAPKG
jgi:hypothetical protein